METAIDDMNPEMLGFTMDKLFDIGALDTYYTPIYMKKNRPAVKLTVVALPEKESEMINLILSETSTLGVRSFRTKRYFMEREIRIVSTKYGDIRVKVAKKGDILKYAPEYEDCKLKALEYNEPLWKIYNEVNLNMGN